MLSTRDHLKTRDTYRLKVKGWKMIFHAKRDQKKTRVAILRAGFLGMLGPMLGLMLCCHLETPNSV